MSNVGDLGRRVAERRQELGLSPEALAERAGMDPRYLRTLEQSPSPQLSRAALWRLAAALETTVEGITGAGAMAPPGQSGSSQKPSLDTLAAEACRELIAPGGVGRVVFNEPRGPVALPVNFRLVDGDVVFRTTEIPALAASLAGGPVSFEVDHVDEALAEGWSVLVSGTGRILEDPAERRAADQAGVEPWAGGERDVYVRISPHEVTGRRIRRK